MSIRSQFLPMTVAVLLGIGLGGCKQGFLSKHSEQNLALSRKTVRCSVRKRKTTMTTIDIWRAMAAKNDSLLRGT